MKPPDSKIEKGPVRARTTHLLAHKTKQPRLWYNIQIKYWNITISTEIKEGKCHDEAAGRTGADKWFKMRQLTYHQRDCFVLIVTERTPPWVPSCASCSGSASYHRKSEQKSQEEVDRSARSRGKPCITKPITDQVCTPQLYAVQPAAARWFMTPLNVLPDKMNNRPRHPAR